MLSRKLLETLNTLRIGKAFLALVQDPKRTAEVFKIIDIVCSDTYAAGAQLVVDHAMSHPEFARLYQRDYQLAASDFATLGELPAGTLGRAYFEHMHSNNLRPDFYPLPAASSPIAFITQRTLESHDIWHALTGYGADVVGETALQSFTLAQIRSGVSAILVAAGMLHVMRYSPARIVEVMDAIIDGYAHGKRCPFLLGICWEDRWAEPLATLRSECRL